MGESKPDSRRSTLLILGTIAGLAVAAAAWGWTLLEKPTDAWSPEQAKALQTARDAAHAARGGGVEVRELSPELQKAQAMVDRLEADLEMARSYRSKWATRVAAGGLALTIACGLGYLAARGD
jgi:hypothetical protein